MISAWWTLFAFFGGGCVGVLLVAMMRVAADADRDPSVAGEPEMGVK